MIEEYLISNQITQLIKKILFVLCKGLF